MELTLKLLIDSSKGKERVLYAETRKECIDSLFHLLSLPIGSLIATFHAQEMAMGGCLSDIYSSLDTLGDMYIVSHTTKNRYLRPPPLLDMGSEISTDIYTCDSPCPVMYISDDPLAECPTCKKLMERKLVCVSPTVKEGEKSAYSGGVVKDIVTYLIYDNMTIEPLYSVSPVSLLKMYNIEDIGALEERVVNVGKKEALRMIKAAFLSETVLTDVFCK